MELLAPAKINLSLEIKGRRADGFHEIETLMCPVSVFDRLTFKKCQGSGLRFTCDDPSLPTGPDNLVVRAADLFFAHTGCDPAVEIALFKAIPHGAGLGGGSSDAATVLLGLNKFCGIGLSVEVLASLGAQLGSDVPFFIFESPAVCRGRGEQVAPVPMPGGLPLLLVKPPFGVPTPWAYQNWKESLEIPGLGYGPQPLAWGALSNDLERPVFEKYFLLAELKRWLREQPEVEGALMSGSGSTVFAVLGTDTDAAELESRLVQIFGPNLWIRACTTH